MVLGLVKNVPPASAENVDCTILKDAIIVSEQDFIAIRGVRRDVPADPELAKLQGSKGMNYTLDEYASERRLVAATNCSVIVARAEDPESIISEARFVCDWPLIGKTKALFGAIKKALQTCEITAQVEEEDIDRYAFTTDRGASSERWGSASVSADRQSATPMLAHQFL